MSEKTPSLTYFQKTTTTCPVCTTEFYREDLLTGRGRMIAGNLTIELRRNYEPSKKFGEIFPLVYPITVCPNCYFAANKDDFLRLPEGQRDDAYTGMSERIQSVSDILEGVDFHSQRGLKEGVASQLLSVLCYDFFPNEFATVIKQGINCLRAAWLVQDLHKKLPKENYRYLSNMFYRKAWFFYTLALEYEQNGKQSIGGCPNLGPDLDKNYAYDGVMYMCGYLEYHYGPRKDPDKRKESLERAKRTVARIFGMGKASKNKPQAILDNARDLYQQIAESLGLDNMDPEKDPG